MVLLASLPVSELDKELDDLSPIASHLRIICTPTANTKTLKLGSYPFGALVES